MKKLLFFILLTAIPLSFINGQSKKEEKEAAARVLFEKTVALIESKDYVIVPESYESSDGTIQNNTDEANFLSYENGENIFLQGMIICSNSNTNKTVVNSYEQKYDKKGNLSVVMQVTGAAIKAKIEISVKKGSNYVEVVVTPTQGNTRIFSGEVVPRKQAKYYKRPNVV